VLLSVFAARSSGRSANARRGWILEQEPRIGRFTLASVLQTDPKGREMSEDAVVLYTLNTDARTPT